MNFIFPLLSKPARYKQAFFTVFVWGAGEVKTKVVSHFSLIKIEKASIT
jgi:hypothetical protein